MISLSKFSGSHMGDNVVQKKITQDSPSALVDLLYRLKKRHSLIVWCVAICLTSAIYFSFVATPIYSSTAVVKIAAKTSISPLTGQLMESESWSSQQLDFRTNFSVITSNPVLERVLKAMPLSEEKLQLKGLKKIIFDILSNTRKLVKDIIGSESSKADLDPAKEAHETLVTQLKWLREHIDVDEIRETRLLTVSVEDPDPVFARDLANTVANTFIQYEHELNLESEKKTLLWMQEQIYEAKKRVEDSEKRFIDYKEREKIFSIAGRQKIFSDKMAETNKAFIDTRTKRQETDARIREIQSYIAQIRKGNDEISIPQFASGELLRDLYAKYLDTEVEAKRLSSVYGPKHPEIKKITNKVNSLRSKVRQEVGKILQNLRAERSVLSARERSLQNAMQSYERQAIEANSKELAYNFLEREVETNRQLYNMLMSKTKEAKVTGAITQGTLQLAEPALIPTVPIKPRRILNILMGFFVGFFLGVGLALIRDMMDQTVHNGEEAERYLGLTVLAEVPKIKRPERYRGEKKDWLQPNVVQMPMNSHFTESFRMLATNLSLSQLKRHQGVFLLTSTSPQEGKSTTALNLGLTMATQGKSTIVVEGDLRRPTTHRQIKGRKHLPGLSDFLIDLTSRDVSRGNLEDLGAVDLHKILRIQERTGTVVYDTPKGEFVVSLLKGRVVEATWQQRPPRIHLGEFLVEKGIISDEQAKMALQFQRQSHRRLGQILLSLGFAKVEDIAGPISINTSEDLQELYRFQQGTFVFKEDAMLGEAELDPQEERLLKLLSESESGVSLPKSRYLLDQMEELLVDYDMDNFGYLPAGKSLPNPATIIASKSLQYLIEEIKQHYDVVIIDSPPARIVSDASVLAAIADVAIIIVRSGKTPKRQANITIEQLTNVDVNIIGCVVNGLDFALEHYANGYSGSYGYYYGESKI